MSAKTRTPVSVAAEHERMVRRRTTGADRRLRARTPRSDGQPPTTAATRVLVIGEHQLLAEALGVALAGHAGLRVVGVAADAQLGATHVRQTQPDVLLLQQGHADAASAQLAGTLVEEFAYLKIVVLTTVYDEAGVFACIKSGAAGYLTMDRGLNELARSIRHVQAGAVLFAPELLMGLLTRSRRQRQLASGAVPGPRELAVLQAFAGGASTEQAATELGISVHTVRTHLKNAMAKFEAHSKLEAVMLAVREGLIELDSTPR